MKSIKIQSFISHSHDDGLLAKRLSRAINTYRPPKKSELGHKKLTAFLDVDRLTVGGSLPEHLETHVRKSQFFILLGSPAAARSSWVSEEISVFLKYKGDETILPVLVGGTPETSFPLNLLKRTPIFLNLSNLRKWPWDRIRFKLAALRLIAAMYGVEYNKLRREEEEQKRKRILLSILASIVGISLVVAAYLISITPSRFWEEIKQPASNIYEPLKPIEQFAASKVNPGIILWRGINSNWVNQPTLKAEDFYSLELSETGPSLNELSKLYLADSVNRLILLAQQSISFSDFNDVELAKGRIRIFGFRRNGITHYYRDFEFEPIDTAFNPLYLPPRDAGSEMYSLSPWPLKELFRSGFQICPDYQIRSYLSGPIFQEVSQLNYYCWGADEGIDEANEIMQHEVLLTNWNDLSIILDSVENISLEEEIEYDWDDIAETEHWATYKPPTIKDGDLNGYEDYDSITYPFIWEWLRHNVDSLSYMSHDYSLVSRQSNVDSQRVEIISTQSLVYETENIPPEINLFAKYSILGQWHHVNLPGNLKDKIIDVIQLNNTPQFIIAVTERSGIFISEDGSKTWVDGNYGESRFLLGSEIKIIEAAGEIYALVTGAKVGEKGNPLFHFSERNWWLRLRTSLVNIIEKK